MIVRKVIIFAAYPTSEEVRIHRGVSHHLFDPKYSGENTDDATSDNAGVHNDSPK
jgi:hypothetical protein